MVWKKSMAWNGSWAAAVVNCWPQVGGLFPVNSWGDWLVDFLSLFILAISMGFVFGLELGRSLE
jgi:hypothetical protein